MSRVIINQFDVMLPRCAYAALNRKYDFWCVARKPRTGSYYISSAVLNDDVLLSSALATQYTGGNGFVVMFEDGSPRGRNKHEQILMELLERHSGDFASYDNSLQHLSVPFSDSIGQHRLIQLLFNALKRIDGNSGEHKSSLLSGALYVVSRLTRIKIRHFICARKKPMG